MVAHLTHDQKFDLSILLGAFLALYWILYVDSLTGEVLGLALGSLPVLVGVYLYVDPDQYVLQTLAGLAAVAIGGAAPATILYGTPAGNWLVGSQPLPLALGLMLVVVIATLVLRRTVRLTAVVGEKQPN
jgi:hypothetical protein